MQDFVFRALGNDGLRPLRGHRGQLGSWWYGQGRGSHWRRRRSEPRAALRALSYAEDDNQRTWHSAAAVCRVPREAQQHGGEVLFNPVRGFKKKKQVRKGICPGGLSSTQSFPCEAAARIEHHRTRMNHNRQNQANADDTQQICEWMKLLGSFAREVARVVSHTRFVAYHLGQLCAGARGLRI